MARADISTLLSLDRYAQIMGISPVRFNGATTPSLDTPVFPNQGCDDIWFQYSWQKNDRVGREHLARKIHNAEKEIANLIGFYPAPKWIVGEVIDFQRPFPREYYGNGYDIRGNAKSITAQYGKYISGGRRETISLGEAITSGGTLVYSDEDSDNFYETATITLPIPDTVPDNSNAKQFKTYFDGYSSDEWEIRYPNTFEISGNNIILTYDSWLFIDPDIWERLPTNTNMNAIDISTTNNFVDAVDVYYVQNDYTVTSAEFYWDDVSQTTQEGFVLTSMSKEGILRPKPGSYDIDNEQWNKAAFTKVVEPDVIKVWYYAGDMSQQYISGKTADPLSTFWAETIAILTTARLKRILADCPTVKNTVEYWQLDLSKITGNTSHFQRDVIQNSPFGSRRGEVEAWQRISRFVKQKRLGYAVI